MNNTAVSLPITTKNRQLAREFAAQQTTKDKSAQVLLNTLAVLAVKNYFDLLEFPTDLAECDSNDPVMRVCSDVADLEIVGYGKIECRPVTNSATSCYVPMDVWELRLGYLAVQIDDSLKEAKILGFITKVTEENVALAQFKPIEALIDRLHDLEVAENGISKVDLQQWFDRIFTPAWEAVEILFPPEQIDLAWGFRSGETPANPNSESDYSEDDNKIRRAKLIDLGIQLSDRQVILLVEVASTTDGRVDVTLQVHPKPKEVYLPQNLSLQVLKSSGEIFMESQARSRDNYIQLQFSGQPGEAFVVKVALDNAEFKEHFQL